MALDLHGRIAGIPVPVIGGVLGLGLVAVFYFQSARKASTAAAAPTTVAVPDLGPGDQVNSTESGNGSLSSGAVAQFVSNATWRATALGWETTVNGSSPLTVQRVMGKYLEGETLTFEEGEMMDRIIGRFGMPPQGVTGDSAVTPKVKIPLKDPAIEPDDLPTAFVDYLNSIGMSGSGAAVVAANLAAGRAKFALPSATFAQPAPVPAQTAAPADEYYVQKPTGTTEQTSSGLLTYTDDGYVVRGPYGYSSTSFAR